MTKTRTPRRQSRPLAKAGPQYVGRFAWSEYWRHWDEILDCTVDELGRSHWTVRRVGETEARSHCTDIPEDCIHAAPKVENGRHLPPQAKATPAPREGNLQECATIKAMAASEAARAMANLARLVSPGRPVGIGVWEGSVSGRISGLTYGPEHVAVFSDQALIAPFGPRGDQEAEAAAALFVIALQAAERLAAEFSPMPDQLPVAGVLEFVDEDAKTTKPAVLLEDAERALRSARQDAVPMSALRGAIDQLARRDAQACAFFREALGNALRAVPASLSAVQGA